MGSRGRPASTRRALNARLERLGLVPVSRGGDTAAYALLDFVYASYPGRAKPEELQRSKGLTPDELGKRLVAWCKELVKKG